MSFNRYALSLQFAREYSRANTIDRVLDGLSDAISECDRLVTEAQKSGNPEYIDAVIDDESDVVESLVGAAFVAAQTQITALVSAVMRLHKRAEKDGHLLKSSSGLRADIIVLGNTVIGSSSVHRVQVIEAAANYFKHHDEWPASWSASTDKRQIKAASVLKALGCSEGSTGNLRKCLDALGIPYDRLSDLHKELAQWVGAVVVIYEAELRNLGLLK